MSSPDGPQADAEVDLDDEDLSPNVRRFLQIIADEDGSVSLLGSLPSVVVTA